MSGPRVFGLPHLSEDAVAAFADGVLSAAAASRAQRHCAECAECADAVRGQRETAMMLRAAQAPALPSGLLARLTGVPMSAPLPPPRGGLPTVLGADGIAMFVAHDARKASEAGSAGKNGEAGEARPADRSDGRAQTQARPAHRRAALPVTVLASAAAVVAAGTFGGHVSTLAAAVDRQAPTGVANAAGAVTGGPASGVWSASPLGGTGSLLPASHSPAGPASTAPDQASRPVLAPAGPLSVTLAPLRQATPQAGTALHQPGTPSERQGGTASERQAGTASQQNGSRQQPVRHGPWPSAALAAMMTGAPTATP
ncbi:hypothetical protein [Jatrophihabitans sp.]|jgi:hypothetical protein|uniref:hypothetical protein n=1 Tax=Jatrophihabitans sp. TaxID=1932789 RepID=UPI002F15074E